MCQISRKWVEGLKIVAPIILLSVILPTWDVFSDLRLIYKIFNEEFATCSLKWWEISEPKERRSYEYKRCPSGLFNCDLWYQCQYHQYTKHNMRNFCMRNSKACDFHKIDFGVMLLGITQIFTFQIHLMICTIFTVPFLLAYFKNFYTWWSVASNKKLTFILPLLNLYPQFGKLKPMYFAYF